MQSTKYHRLRADCQAAIAANNLEKCFELLADSLDERTAAYTDYIVLRGRLSGVLHLWSSGQTTSQDYSQTLNQVRAGLLHFVNNIQPIDVSLLRRIHDRILIVACKNSPTEWEGLFPEAYFSHRHIICYGEEVPTDFQSPDVVIFDDLECPGIGNHAKIKTLSESMPDANLLYFGKKNPFEEGTKEEQVIFPRMANANSKFTVHARLRELLEYRKIYGVPASVSS